MRAKWTAWLEALRPKTLLASVAPVLVGTALAYSAGAGSPVLFLVVLIAAICIQITTNFANDIFDHQKGADTSERLGPQRGLQRGVLSLREMWFGLAFVICVALVCGTFLIAHAGWPIFLIGLSGLIFAVLYTAGPHALAYNGFADLFVFLYFGPIAVAGTYFVYTQRFDCSSAVLGTALGALSVAILTVNNLRDVDQDRKVNKRTLVVRNGRTFAKVYYTFLLLYAAVVPVLMYFSNAATQVAFIVPVSMLFIVPSFRKVWSERDLNAALAGSARTLLLYSLFLSAAWIVS